MRALQLLAALIGCFAMGGGCGRSGTSLDAGAGGGGAMGGSSASGGASATAGAGGIPGTGGVPATSGLSSGGASGTSNPDAPANTGGSTGSGGITDIGGSTSGSGGAGGSCANLTPCGGDVVGTWTVTSSCLQVSGEVDMREAADLTCPTGTVEGSLYVTGIWTADSDGTYADDTVTTGYNVFDLPPACKELSGTTVVCGTIADVVATSMGYASVSAMSAVHGGCVLLATVDQKGRAGLVLPHATPGGHYATSGGVLKMTNGTEYSYCVSGNTMTWTPKSSIGAITGTVVFQRGGNPGTGGAGGSPGTGGKDGGTGTGGTGGSPDAGCTGDLATVAAWGVGCAERLCDELLWASNCEVSLQSALRVSGNRGCLRYDLSDTKRKICSYLSGWLIGAAAWDDATGFCNGTSSTIVGGSPCIPGPDSLPVICERGSPSGTGGAVGSGNDAGSQVIPPAQCWNRMENTCYPCCPDPLPDCTDKPDGYPYPCVVSGGDDWCVCKCRSGRWQCGC